MDSLACLGSERMANIEQAYFKAVPGSRGIQNPVKHCSIALVGINEHFIFWKRWGKTRNYKVVERGDVQEYEVASVSNRTEMVHRRSQRGKLILGSAHRLN